MPSREVAQGGHGDERHLGRSSISRSTGSLPAAQTIVGGSTTKSWRSSHSSNARRLQQQMAPLPPIKVKKQPLRFEELYSLARERGKRSAEGISQHVEGTLKGVEAFASQDYSYEMGNREAREEAVWAASVFAAAAPTPGRQSTLERSSIDFGLVDLPSSFANLDVSGRRAGSYGNL